MMLACFVALCFNVRIYILKSAWSDYNHMDSSAEYVEANQFNNIIINQAYNDKMLINTQNARRVRYDDGWSVIKRPTNHPTQKPTPAPSLEPTQQTTLAPTSSPTNLPTKRPTTISSARRQHESAKLENQLLSKLLKPKNTSSKPIKSQQKSQTHHLKLFSIKVPTDNAMVELESILIRDQKHDKILI